MRSDVNQGEIVRAFRQCGASVKVLSQVGAGFPDLLIGWRGENILVEVKSGRGKLRENQKEFREVWRGKKPVVIRTTDEVFLLLNGVISDEM